MENKLKNYSILQPGLQMGASEHHIHHKLVTKSHENSLQWPWNNKMLHSLLSTSNLTFISFWKMTRNRSACFHIIHLALLNIIPLWVTIIWSQNQMMISVQLFYDYHWFTKIEMRNTKMRSFLLTVPYFISHIIFFEPFHLQRVMYLLVLYYISAFSHLFCSYFSSYLYSFSRLQYLIKTKLKLLNSIFSVLSQRLWRTQEYNHIPVNF